MADSPSSPTTHGLPPGSIQVTLDRDEQDLINIALGYFLDVASESGYPSPGLVDRLKWRLSHPNEPYPEESSHET